MLAIGCKFQKVGLLRNNLAFTCPLWLCWAPERVQKNRTEPSCVCDLRMVRQVKTFGTTVYRQDK